MTLETLFFRSMMQMIRRMHQQNNNFEDIPQVNMSNDIENDGIQMYMQVASQDHIAKLDVIDFEINEMNKAQPLSCFNN